MTFNCLPDLLDSIVLIGVVELDGVVSSGKTNDPVFVVHYISLSSKFIFEERKFLRCASKCFSDLLLVLDQG